MQVIYYVLFFAIIANAGANILIKIGMRNVGKLDVSQGVLVLFKIFFNPYVLIGIFSFILALGAYSFVLSHLNLSIAYPIMTSLGYIIVIVFSAYALHETITFIQWTGIALIFMGVMLVAK